MYQSRPQRRHRRSQDRVLAGWIILIGCVLFAYGIATLFFGDDVGIEQDINIRRISDSAQYEVRIADTDVFSGSDSITRLNEGDTIRSGGERGVQLSLFGANGTTLTLDQNTELVVDVMRQRDDQHVANLTLVSGQVWFRVSDLIDETVTLTTGDVDIVATSGEGNLSTETLSQISGTSTLKGDDEPLIVETGQSVSLDESPLQVGILDVDFLQSAWYKWNDERIVRPEPETPDTDDTQDTSDAVDDTDTSTTSDTTDTTSSSDDQQLTSPKPDDNGDYRAGVLPVRMTGVPPAGTAAVLVNNYRLQSFNAAAGEWKYILDRQYSNIQSGDNTYTVRFLDSSGDLLDEREYTIEYDPSLNESPLTITRPVDGARISEDLVRISGTVPESAVRVQVNDYTLRLFEAGSGVYEYRMSSELGNRVTGEQTITVRAFARDGSELDREEITVTLLEPSSNTNN